MEQPYEEHAVFKVTDQIEPISSKPYTEPSKVDPKDADSIDADPIDANPNALDHSPKGNLQKEDIKTWSEWREKYNAGALEKLIKDITAFDFNFDYSEFNNPEDVFKRIDEVLVSLVSIITSFKIIIKLPEISQDQELQLASQINNYQKEERMVMLWLEEASAWVNDVIRPLLTSIKGLAEFSNLGKMYETETDSILRKMAAWEKYFYGAITITQEILNYCHMVQADFSASVNEDVYAQIHYRRQLIESHQQPGADYRTRQQLAKGVGQFIDPKSALEACYKAHSFDTLLPIETDFYFSIVRKQDQVLKAIAIGFICLAQQELSQPVVQSVHNDGGQQPVLHQLAQLLAPNTKSTIAKIIARYSIKETGSYFYLNHATNDDDAKEFLNHLISRLREKLVRHRRAELARDIKNNCCDLRHHAWSDVLLLFWHYYDGSVSSDQLKSYICQDKTIKARVLNAVNEVQRLEKDTDEKIVTKQKQASKLTSKGMLKLISHLLVSANRASDTIYTDAKDIIVMNVNVFKIISLSDLMRAFLFYFDGPECHPHTTIHLYFDARNRQAIQEVASHFKTLAANGENIKQLIELSPDKKILSVKGLQILRDCLANSNVAVSANNNQIPPSTFFSTLSSSASGYFNAISQALTGAKADYETKSKGAANTDEIELKSLHDKSPLLNASHAVKHRDQVPIGGYGTCSPAAISTPREQAAPVEQLLTSERSIPIEKSKLKENSLPLFPIDPIALDNYSLTSQDVITLVKQIFKLNVEFYGSKQKNYKEVPKEKSKNSTDDHRPTLHICIEEHGKARVFVDPFPHCTGYITQRMVALSKSITKAQISKQEIFRLFEPIAQCYSSQREMNEVTRKFVQFFKEVIKACRNDESTAGEILELIRTNLISITQSDKLVFSRENIVWNDFIHGINYLFHRAYGKSYAEVNALSKQTDLAAQQADGERLSHLRAVR